MDVAPFLAWRRRRMLTIKVVHEASGISTRTIQDAEAGAHSLRFGTMRALADALGVEPSQIVEFRPWLGLERSS